MFTSLFNSRKNQRFVSVDIGTSAIKLMELDMSSSKPALRAAGHAPTPANAISNNAISDTESVARVIRSILDENEISATNASFAVPGPCTFTKKVTLGFTDLKSLDTNIRFEASNYIPHNINAVHLDYQVIKANGKSSIDVLLVAVKNEIVNSYIETIEKAGLKPSIADIDYFALENMFEVNYPEESQSTVALVNMGARYTSVNIIQDQESLFTGDVGVGGRLYTDALVEALEMKPIDAERAKVGQIPAEYDEQVVKEVIDRTSDHIANELHRQLGFFWNAAATDRSIEAIYASGGGAQVPGLLEELGAKTGMVCKVVDSLRGVEWQNGFDGDYIDEISHSMAVSVGLASRRFGDKQQAIH